MPNAANSPLSTLLVYAHPAKLGGCPPTAGKPLSAPAPPLFRSARGGSVAPERAVPGGAGRRVGEELPKVPREALVLPHLEAAAGAAAARQVRMARGPRSPRAELGRRDSTRLCGASALGPSRAAWARGPAPAPSRWPRPAPPRPSPPLRGTLQLVVAELEQFEAVTLPPLVPHHSPSPGASPPTSPLGPWRPREFPTLGCSRPNPAVQRKLRLPCAEPGKAFWRRWPLPGTPGLSRCRPERPSLSTQGKLPWRG